MNLAEIKAAKPLAPPARGLGHLIGAMFRQVALNPFNLGFALAMPVLMYLMFGANQEYSSYSVGSGNVAAQVLVSMTLFGVLLSSASFGASVSLERAQGVGRLYALTPLSATWQIVGRLIASVGVSSLVILVTYLVGHFTGAQMSGSAWVVTAILVMICSALASAIGFGCGFALRSDGAYAATSAVIVLSAFGAGMTIPLDQMGEFFQRLAPWTPLWGVNEIVIRPLFGWDGFTPNMVLSFLGWTGAFMALAIWGLRRDTGR